MSLILCRQEQVTSPYYIEELDISLYSSQELCYVIYNHPLLVMEDFVNDRLTAFLRNQLRLPFLADKLEKWLEGRGASDELLFLILQECFYYSVAEQARYRQEVMRYRKLPMEEYEKLRADYFYGRQLYALAVSIYERILENREKRELSPQFRAKLWNNIAACYTKLFCHQKAMNAYESAWNEMPSDELLKRMYFLTLMQPELTIRERFGEKLTDEKMAVWNAEAQGIIDEGKSEATVAEIEELFQKDSIRRQAGASELINRWKLEYRRMLLA